MRHAESLALRPPPSPERWTAATAAPACPPEDRLDELVRAPGRVALTAALGLLDRDVDEAVNQAVRLARQLTDAPVSFLGAVGAAMDHYKAIEGVPPPLSEARTLPGRTFCHYTHALQRTLVIDDARLASPWREVPTVQSLGVVAYLGVPVRHAGHVVGSLCVVDMTPRAWTPRDIDTLEALALSLEREFALRAALRLAEDDARRQAEAVLQRESLVANVLHDLATPMQSIQLTLAVLKPAATTPELSPAVDRLGRATEMLRDLVATLNTRHLPDGEGRVGPGADQLAPLDLDEVLGDAARMFEPLAARDGLGFARRLDCGALVRVGRGELLRLVANLVGNAFKFSSAGGVVTLATGHDDAPGWVWLSVRDQGVGMRPDQVARCTERGYSDGHGRGDSTGLGLAIAQQIATQRGGELCVTSAPGRGTEVRIRWPACG